MPEPERSPEASLHGVLVDVFGVGILLVGESGSGKSECALDLVSRGHRLVADDVVEVAGDGRGGVLGWGPARLGHHMEIRGLGIIDVQALFGVAATRGEKRIGLVLQLEPWNPGAAYDRLGLEEERFSILGASLPLRRIPISAGRNLAILVEVAARSHLLHRMGVHAARAFTARMAPAPGPRSYPQDSP